MKCPNCNKEVSQEWEICPFCKYEPVKCSNPECNTGWLPQEALFCPECGTSISGLLPFSFEEGFIDVDTGRMIQLNDDLLLHHIHFECFTDLERAKIYQFHLNDFHEIYDRENGFNYKFYKCLFEIKKLHEGFGLPFDLEKESSNMIDWVLSNHHELSSDDERSDLFDIISIKNDVFSNFRYTIRNGVLITSWGEQRYRLFCLKIKDNVEIISDSAFAQCHNLRKVELSTNLKKIGVSSFEGCGMEEINIPSTVTHIEKKAFAHCHNLLTVVLPTPNPVIEEGVFQGCLNIRNINIPFVLSPSPKDIEMFGDPYTYTMVMMHKTLKFF